MSEVLTEILKVDPSFDKDRFLKQCERDIIPNVLEVTQDPFLSCIFPFIIPWKVVFLLPHQKINQKLGQDLLLQLCTEPWERNWIPHLGSNHEIINGCCGLENNE